MMEKANVPLGQSSRGMRQRIGLANLIIHEPALIFLDEPTFGSDPQGQKDIQTIIQRFKSRKRSNGIHYFASIKGNSRNL